MKARHGAAARRIACSNIPQTFELLRPILRRIPLQLLVFQIAVLRNCDMDRPGNLAKNVTVESAVGLIRSADPGREE